jgi:hypothetical protein
MKKLSTVVQSFMVQPVGQTNPTKLFVSKVDRSKYNFAILEVSNFKYFFLAVVPAHLVNFIHFLSSGGNGRA